MKRLVLLAVAAMSLMGAGDRRSGYDDASADTRAMQDDDAANPAFLWVQQGESLWSAAEGAAGFAMQLPAGWRMFHSSGETDPMPRLSLLAGTGGEPAGMAEDGQVLSGDGERSADSD